jgi:hypothetical protein
MIGARGVAEGTPPHFAKHELIQQPLVPAIKILAQKILAQKIRAFYL